MDILAKDDPTAMPSAFKAEIIKTRKDHRDLMKVRIFQIKKKKKPTKTYFHFSLIILYHHVKLKDEQDGHKQFGNLN
jgi:hypothetical protein